ncbi:Hypothetical predicted protein [Olea europaea subsp. europaea]|uniref:Uncharacterized protein n=1 Tax=Olea europaea subsp. europaea TaxID=158383 RepID=A0A8S0RCN3_OLEEU|nr:Hypothetical predicted protein [Olea europaea subsp. europaea]
MLDKLPFDIFESILQPDVDWNWDMLDGREAWGLAINLTDLACLARTSKALYHAANPFLYQIFDTRAVMDRRLLRSLQNNPGLGTHVKWLALAIEGLALVGTFSWEEDERFEHRLRCQKLYHNLKIAAYCPNVIHLGVFVAHRTVELMEFKDRPWVRLSEDWPPASTFLFLPFLPTLQSMEIAFPDQGAYTYFDFIEDGGMVINHQALAPLFLLTSDLRNLTLRYTPASHLPLESTWHHWSQLKSCHIILPDTHEKISKKYLLMGRNLSQFTASSLANVQRLFLQAPDYNADDMSKFLECLCPNLLHLDLPWVKLTLEQWQVVLNLMPALQTITTSGKDFDGQAELVLKAIVMNKSSALRKIDLSYSNWMRSRLIVFTLTPLKF